MRAGGAETTWSWVSGVRRISENGDVTDLGVGGLFGLIAISVVSGLVGGVAEALGQHFFLFIWCGDIEPLLQRSVRLMTTSHFPSFLVDVFWAFSN